MSDILELNEWLSDVLRTLVEEGHAIVCDPTGQTMNPYDSIQACLKGGTIQISFHVDPMVITRMRCHWNLWMRGYYTTSELLTRLKRFWGTLVNVEPAWSDEFLDALYLAGESSSEVTLTRIYELLAAPKMQRPSF